MAVGGAGVGWRHPHGNSHELLDKDVTKAHTIVTYDNIEGFNNGFRWIVWELLDGLW